MTFIDSFGPLELHRLETVDGLAETVRQAAGDAIYPVGGGTMLELGMPPTRTGIALSTERLDQIIDYPARDMTITVQSGITIEKLRATLAAEGQRLPVDVPVPSQATLAGAIACNVSGPRRYGYGTFRDYVIGISVVNAEGREIKAGGRVVKNVAGYDLCKLYTGSLGTLGIITQVTLKVRPQPEVERTVIFSCSLPALGELLDQLHVSQTRPISIDVVGSSDSECQVLVGYDDTMMAVDWQVDRLFQELAPNASTRVEDGAGTLDRRFSEIYAAPATLLRAVVLPGAVAEFLRFSWTVLPASSQVHAHAGNGIVYFRLPADIEFETAARLVRELRSRAIAGQGSLVVCRCPPEWKVELDLWGEPREDVWLMREIKKQLDPRDCFNPGRFVV